jgi:LCP family protein required for cell wall assembly
VRPRRSAFAAAFLSFLFPGLGHAYLGRWLRALAWAALPILVIAGLGGLAITAGIKELAGNLFDPAVLSGVIAFLVVDFFYRLLALLDAYRLASDPGVGSTTSRMLSSAGLVVIIVVLVGSHVAVAQPVFFASDTLKDISDAGDDSEVLTAEELAARGGEDFDLITAKPLAQETSEPGATPVPTEAAQPTPQATERPIWDGKERLNILLIGSDGGRRGHTSFLTDTMITVSVDPTTGRVAFISLPRDTTGVPLPSGWPAYRALGGKYNNKINTLYYLGRARSDLFPGNDKDRGYNALMGALGELYGLDIRYYVAVDISSFRSVVNTLGGVVVDVQLPVYDTGYPTDDGRGKLKLYLPPGIKKMNGQTSLAYARSRHATSDFDRAARQQRVVTSVREQTDIDDLLQPGVVTGLIKELRNDVKTNIPTQLVPKLMSLAQDIDLDRRENLVLSGSRFTDECWPCPVYELKAKPGSIKSAVQNIFSTSKAAAKSINAVAEEGAIVHILNGKGGANALPISLAAKLAKKGVSATVPPIGGGRADRNDYTDTVITFYNGAAEAMPQTAKQVKRAIKDKRREIVLVDDPDAQADIVVTVGSDTKT